MRTFAKERDEAEALALTRLWKVAANQRNDVSAIVGFRYIGNMVALEKFKLLDGLIINALIDGAHKLTCEFRGSRRRAVLQIPQEMNA